MSYDRKKLGPPPRWINCPRKGQLIQGKFLPFKTPLDNRYEKMIPEYSVFTLDLLFSSLKTMKVKMGLLIDLTNTTRFYNSQEIESKFDCRYVKLQCRGHGETPAPDQTRAFIDLCARFIRQKPLEIIGVHCTHGFNRTGFLIAAYLVENCSWSVEAAVQCFAKAREPGIYKQDYLQELFKLYGEVEDTFPAPALPSWCDEDSETVDDDGNFIAEVNEATSKSKNKKREFVRKDAKFMEGVKGISQLRLQPKLSEVQRKCQLMCGWGSSGFPGSQPVSMDIHNLRFLREKEYKVSWKADGTRYMMLIDGASEVYMVDRDNTVFHVPNLRFPHRKDLGAHLRETLLDGEMILDKVDGNTVPRFLVYDIIKFSSTGIAEAHPKQKFWAGGVLLITDPVKGQDVGKVDFKTRLVCIEREIIGPRHAAITQGLLDKTREPFSVRIKPFWNLEVCRKLLDGTFLAQVSHEVDGLVFQPVPDPYVAGRCQDVLKWKPPDQNSIDFKLKIVKENKEGMLPTTKAYLFVLHQDAPLAELKFKKELKELDGKIVECYFDGREWKFMRQRTDKSFPNSINTARGVWESIQSPVTKEILFNVVEKEKFMPSQGKRRHNDSNDSMPPPEKVPRR